MKIVFGKVKLKNAQGINFGLNIVLEETRLVKDLGTYFK